mgnify:CR=1 FL=1
MSIVILSQGMAADADLHVPPREVPLLSPRNPGRTTGAAGRFRHPTVRKA